MFVKLFSIMVAISIIVIMSALGFMAADRGIPIELIKVESSTPVVRPGGKLEWRITIIQHKRCHTVSNRTLIDARGKRYPLPVTEYQAGIGPVGTPQDILVSIPIPTDMAIGTARYEVSTSYRCNALHNIWPIYSPYRPVFFEVVML
ncbi:MAG: hypothetical protein H0U63_01115 [Burkholderiales bacterium]|nr:hypothetical protein [Burkholderiales bacterium]